MMRTWMRVSMFLMSLITLVISMKLFYNQGIFVDEYNLSPDIISGGGFWNLMDWFRLGLLGLLCAVTLMNIFSGNRGEK